jgi:hypothetical protein
MEGPKTVVIMVMLFPPLLVLLLVWGGLLASATFSQRSLAFAIFGFLFHRLFLGRSTI